MVRLRKLEVAHNGWVPNPSGEAIAILELDEGLTGNAFISLSLYMFSLCPPSAIGECTWARISRSPLRKPGHHPGDERLYPLPSSSSLTSCFSTEPGQRAENGGPSARSPLYWLGLLPSPGPLPLVCSMV